MRKFLFDNSFDPRPPPRAEPEIEEPEVEPEPPPPTFSEEELAAAREKGYAEGRTDGLSEARAAIEMRTADALQAIARGLGDIGERQRAVAEAALTDAADIAVAIARKICPTLARRHGLDEIGHLVRQALVNLIGVPRVVVRVQAGSIEQVRELTEDAARTIGFEGQLVILPDDTLGDGDCRIEWGDGGAERLTGELWRQVDEIVGRYLADSESADGGAARANAA